MKQLDLKPFNKSFEKYDYGSFEYACSVFRLPFSLWYVSIPHHHCGKIEKIIFRPVYVNYLKEEIDHALNKN